jgi:rSAM/selenodomain-associated transferase 1
MDNGLIIFVKNPILGKVKTRLAKTLNEDNALKIYHKLLQHTRKVTENIPVNKYVFYSEYIHYDDLWQNELYEKKLQHGKDLGERMENAFEVLFKNGHKQTIIIGSDCYDLTTDIILTAFDQLKQNDLVIGPAKDGGYYLLGTNSFIPELFAGKIWSSSNVFSETTSQIRSLNYSFYTLPVLSDVDVPGDVNFIF